MAVFVAFIDSNDHLKFKKKATEHRKSVVKVGARQGEVQGGRTFRRIS
jgi:hypothetical protein